MRRLRTSYKPSAFGRCQGLQWRGIYAIVTLAVIVWSAKAFTCGQRDPRSCPSGAVCKSGNCVCLLRDRTICPSRCANLNTDAGNCGSCGNVCKTSQVCVNGQCGCFSAPTNRTIVPGGALCPVLGARVFTRRACKDLRSDAANCGACGNTCGAGQRCCGGACKDLSSDAANCGACGNACGTGENCVAGACAAACRTFTTACLPCGTAGADVGPICETNDGWCTSNVGNVSCPTGPIRCAGGALCTTCNSFCLEVHYLYNGGYTGGCTNNAPVGHCNLV